MKPDAGTFTVGETVKLAIVDQDRDSLDGMNRSTILRCYNHPILSDSFICLLLIAHKNGLIIMIDVVVPSSQASDRCTMRSQVVATTSSSAPPKSIPAHTAPGSGSR